MADEKAYVSLNGVRATAARFWIGWVGMWVLDLEFDSSQPEMQGQKTASIGPTELIGTIDPEHTDNFAEKGRVRLIGGKRGWRELVKARHFHNDAGVKASTVAKATAAEVGETVEVSTDRVLGVDYVRSAGPAARTLDVLYPDGWRVSLDGVTRTGTRPGFVADESTYSLLDYDPRARVATLGVDDARAVMPGAFLKARFDRPFRVKELELRVEKGVAKGYAWGDDG